MAALEETERTQIVAEIENYLKSGPDREFGEFISIPLKSIGGQVIQGALAEVMNGRPPYSDLQYQHQKFADIARSLRDRDLYPLSQLDPGKSAEEKAIQVVASYATRHPADLSPMSRLVQDLGIVEDKGRRCLVSISYRCAIDITSINLTNYFSIGRLNRIRYIFHLPIKGSLPRCTLTLEHLQSAAKCGKLLVNDECHDTGRVE